MIKSLYETHVQVRDLERSIAFYEQLGLTLAHRLQDRRGAFLYMGEERQMLGIWEVAEGQPLHKRHFAFGVELEQLQQSMAWLAKLGIEPIPALGRPPVEPIVHSWMPAAAVYFNDPDENELEFIAWLDGEPDPTLSPAPYLSEWFKLQADKK